MVNNLIRISTAALTALLLQPSYAFDPSTDRIACDDAPFCLTSFVWCGEGSDRDTGCHHPNNTYPERPENGGRNHALLFWEQEYNLTWRVRGNNYPISISWGFGKSSDPEDGTRHQWQRNFTEGETSFSFRFMDLAEEYANDNENITVEAIQGLASSTDNMFQMRQPGRNDTSEGLGPFYDTSDQFALVSEGVRKFMDTQETLWERDAKKERNIGIGVGVGVGVPLVLAIGFLAGTFLSRRNNAHRPSKVSGQGYE